MVEGPRDTPDSLHRQGQHRVPLHRLPRHAEGGRKLHPARQRACQRVPQPRRRQDFDLAQLGGLAPRVPGGLPRQAGRAALRAHRQCSRDQGQRLHLEGLPGTQQQRAGRRLRQLRQPGTGADAEILRRTCPRVRRTDRLRQGDLARVRRREDAGGTSARRLQVPRCAEGSHEPGTHRKQVPG